MSAREQVAQWLESLSEAELQQVADYVAFLKFRGRMRTALTMDPARLAAAYSESKDEDRRLAEEGMSEYCDGLLAEDKR